jgi:uncharacterized protein YidB (DUF937 family)
MDLNSMIELGVNIFGKYISNSSSSDISEVVVDILKDENGKLNIGQLIESFSSSGVADVMASWLGNGENLDIDMDTLASILGEGKVSGVSNVLGLSADESKEVLSKTLPELMDNVSKDGAVLDSLQSDLDAMNEWL